MMKNRNFIIPLLTIIFLLLCPFFTKADPSIAPGDYILVKIPSHSDPLTARDIGVMPAKVFQRGEKLLFYFENTEGPKLGGIDDAGKSHDLSGGVFEIMTSTSRGGLLMFKSVEGAKTEGDNPMYLGSVYRGAMWGSTFRGVFVDQHEKPDGQGLFLLIPTDLTVKLPPETGGGELGDDGN